MLAIYVRSQSLRQRSFQPKCWQFTFGRDRSRFELTQCFATSALSQNNEGSFFTLDFSCKQFAFLSLFVSSATCTLNSDV